MKLSMVLSMMLVFNKYPNGFVNSSDNGVVDGIYCDKDSDGGYLFPPLVT